MYPSFGLKMALNITTHSTGFSVKIKRRLIYKFISYSKKNGTKLSGESKTEKERCKRDTIHFNPLSPVYKFHQRHTLLPFRVAVEWKIFRELNFLQFIETNILQKDSYIRVKIKVTHAYSVCCYAYHVTMYWVIVNSDCFTYKVPCFLSEDSPHKHFTIQLKQLTVREVRYILYTACTLLKFDNKRKRQKKPSNSIQLSEFLKEISRWPNTKQSKNSYTTP